MADAAAAAADAQPAPFRRRTDLAAAKVVGLLCLTSMSAAFAAGAAAAVAAFAACDDDGDACTELVHALGATSTRALLSAALLAPIAPALLARAALGDAGLREALIVGLIGHFQSTRAPVGTILREPVVRAFLATFAFMLLSAIGCLILEGLSPAEGSRMDKIGAMLVVVGQVGSAALACFIIFPLMVVKLWRMKLGDAAIADSNV